MNLVKSLIALILLVLTLVSCKKDTVTIIPPKPEQFTLMQVQVDDKQGSYNFTDIRLNPDIRLKFSAPVDRNSINNNIRFLLGSGIQPFTTSFESNDSVVKFVPTNQLITLTKYSITIFKNLASKKQTALGTDYKISLLTAMDSTDKFPRITDAELLDLIQRKTFSYFWDMGNPVSGMARDRNSSGDIVTSGGTGFGIMSIVVGIERNFITRSQGLGRLLTIAGFLQNSAHRYHGAFPHWLNGTTGETIPFSAQDDGADLVETAFLMQGLLTARQYFNDPVNEQEIQLRGIINTLWQEVEWDWFRKNNENALYWHWSPNNGWAMNMKVQGWNEALMVYVLAASAPTHTINKTVYENGWALNGGIRLNQSYYGFPLQLGEPYGGPLFFAHYSFLGLDPRSLTDQYANYWQQNVNHSKINFTYCKTNPNNNYGYSADCWGLTASDIPSDYTASSPTNDVGVIAPTAAISSLPYTPIESMQAIRFFYYKLGDKIWGDYGFVDAFSMREGWFADSYLAIDQGPEIVMIENYRTQLLWNLFMSCPEVNGGLTKLGFTH
jgi:hypothetical protein